MIHRDTGEPGFVKDSNGVIQRCSVFDHHHVTPLGHCLAGDGVIKPKDPVEHLMLFFFNGSCLFTNIYPGLEFLFCYFGVSHCPCGEYLFNEIIDPENGCENILKHQNWPCDNQTYAFGMPGCIGFGSDFAENEHQKGDYSCRDTDANISIYCDGN